MVEDSTLQRWFRLEANRFNDGVVVSQKTLSRLLAERKPWAKAKNGRMHYFDKARLEEFAARIPCNMRERLRLPIFFHVDLGVDDSVFLTDEMAADAMKHLGELSSLHRFRGDRLWLSKPIAYSIWSRWDGLVQFVVG